MIAGAMNFAVSGSAVSVSVKVVPTPLIIGPSGEKVIEIFSPLRALKLTSLAPEEVNTSTVDGSVAEPENWTSPLTAVGSISPDHGKRQSGKRLVFHEVSFRM